MPQWLLQAIANRKLSSLTGLTLMDCKALPALPEDLSGLTSLEELDLECCSALTALPDSLSALKSLKKLNLNGCESLKAMPGLSALKGLHIEFPPHQLKDWEGGGRKAFLTSK